MSRKKRKKNNGRRGRDTAPVLTNRLKRWISALIMIALSLIVLFSFFKKAGAGGDYLFKVFDYILGKTIFAFPFLLFLSAFFALKPKKRRVLLPVGAGLFFCLAGAAGILTVKTGEANSGGFLGKIASYLFLRYFSPSVAYIVLSLVLAIGLLIFYELLPKKEKSNKEKEEDLGKIEVVLEDERKPKFEIKPVEIIANKVASIFAKENKGEKEDKKEKDKEEKKEKQDF
ncbi:hypothetical protein L6252_03435, partial [Candidatus Parcubacteria bacterium]|nr:hypothetical protein [Candidatus Parcubacteria bacterium]